MGRKLFAAALAAFISIGYGASAFSQTKPDVQVRQRQAVMALQSKYFGPIAMMASGKMPFDPKVAARNAEFLDALVRMPWDNFTADTAAEKTRTLPEVYKETGKFRDAQEKLIGDVGRLVSAARTGNEAGVKAAAGDVGKACAGCHDNFRAKQ